MAKCWKSNAGAEKVGAKFLELLDSLIPNPLRMNFVEAIFRDVWDQRNGSRPNDVERLTTELARLKSLKKSIMARIAILSEQDFAAAYQEVEADISNTKATLDEMGATELSVDLALEYLKSIAYSGEVGRRFR